MSAWSIAEVIVLAVALAFDASAVAVALGAAGARARMVLIAALAFGLSHAGMSALGALGGTWLTTVASAWDHWVAFGLLAAVGVHMIVTASSDADDDAPSPETSIATIASLALATSIDTLATGITLPLMGPPFWLSALLIGVVAGLLSGLAGWAGQRAGALVGPWVVRAAGGVLVLLGLRILIGHLFFP